MLDEFNIPGIIDYLEDAKKFIASKYEPAQHSTEDVKLTTVEIYDGLTKVIPKSEILLQDIYEIMRELGFEPQWTAKESVREKNAEDSPTEVDEESRMDFIWCLRFKC